VWPCVPGMLRLARYSRCMPTHKIASKPWFVWSRYVTLNGVDLGRLMSQILCDQFFNLKFPLFISEQSMPRVMLMSDSLVLLSDFFQFLSFPFTVRSTISSLVDLIALISAVFARKVNINWDTNNFLRDVAPPVQLNLDFIKINYFQSAFWSASDCSASYISHPTTVARVLFFHHLSPTQDCVCIRDAAFCGSALQLSCCS
jgi:hypothetical protein